eukprot:scaffold21844_cov58-Phaeocystis_antarctica.AAC.5
MRALLTCHTPRRPVNLSYCPVVRCAFLLSSPRSVVDEREVEQQCAAQHEPEAPALPPRRDGGSPFTCACAVDDKEIDTAKMQVQGQLAAQYIQDVMQAWPPPPPPQRRAPRSTRVLAACRSCTLLARGHWQRDWPATQPLPDRPPADPHDLLIALCRK